MLGWCIYRRNLRMSPEKQSAVVVLCIFALYCLNVWINCKTIAFGELWESFGLSIITTLICLALLAGLYIVGLSAWTLIS